MYTVISRQLINDINDFGKERIKFVISGDVKLGLLLVKISFFTYMFVDY